MHVRNQQLGSAVHYAHFTPICTNFTNMGTTVTYSSQPTGGINAFSSGPAASGTFAAAQQPAWNAISANVQPWNALSANVQPIVTAGQFTQPVSGAITGYNQFRPFGTAISAYNQYQPFSGTIAGYSALQPYWQLSGHVMVQPSIDISETSSDVVVSAYTPSVDPNNISLSVTDNSVTISAYAWSGNQNLVLNRTVALPTNVRADAINANLQNNGILEIRCPKVEKSTRGTTLSQDVQQQQTV